ncbi:MAG: molybdopterin biosynthesis protein [Chloroflexi bacterium]|nr:molybdopterin biosynthesis protein [Chloroflexota bacterium]
MVSKKIYLDDIPLSEAWARFSAAMQAADKWQPIEGEDVPLDQALGRVTAQPIFAKISAPHYHASAMDGYAVRAEDTAQASDNNPVTLTQIKYVDTGDPLPGWANAVIPIENVQVHENRLDALRGDSISDLQSPISIEIRSALTPWSHVRAMGEDMVATELVLPSNHILRPVDLGAIAGCGHNRVRVRRQPRVAVIPTGTELVPAGSSVNVGDIIEYNSLVLAAQVQTWGGVATRYNIVPDNLEQIVATVREAAATHDLILLNAGSSSGSEDFSAKVVETLGELLVHGIAVRPGHPVILGVISNLHSPIPIIGVPGYPVSAALTGEIFVEPILSKWLGRSANQQPTLQATISRKVLSPMGDDEYMRVTVGKVGSRVVATPLSRGAGVITSLVRADGIVRIPRLSEGVQAGDGVTVHLYRAPAEVDRTIVAIGSHDLCLDLLSQFIAEKSAMRLASANVGSLGGLIALGRGEAHVAGTHLLDPDTGEYNVSYIKRYLPDTPIVLMTFVYRDQGLIVPKGNPKKIRTLADLERASFVNRQRGAGTRVLLDFEIGKIGLSPESIRGYEREEYTHLAVAAAVASGVADCGLGIHSAASALDLDFVPLFKERYDLAIPKEFFESELMRPLLETINDSKFKDAVKNLAGYDIRGMGNIAAQLL